MTNNICVIMNKIKKEINTHMWNLNFWYYGKMDTGLWSYIAKIPNEKYIILTCNKQIAAKNIRIRNIYNWLSLQITSEIDMEGVELRSGGVITGDLQEQPMPHFPENRCVLMYDTRHKKESNIHRYQNDLFSVFVKPKSENCSMQSQAVLSTLMNTFDYSPRVVDLTSCNILQPAQ